MPRDEVLAGDTRAWLEQAAKDLRRVEILLAVTPPDVEGALFHSQQAAEKAMRLRSAIRIQGSIRTKRQAGAASAVERAFRLPCRYSYRHFPKNVGTDADVAT
jgi:hypothetical protein